MTSDLEYLHAHLADFSEYADEAARNGSDMRVRAFVGLALTSVQERAGAQLAPADAQALEKLIFRCQFSDNAYLKRLGHMNLTPDDLAALAREDRKLVEIATRLPELEPSALGACFTELAAQFEARHLPAASSGASRTGSRDTR